MLLARVTLLLIPMIVSLSVHEFAHALLARFFGDRTAQRQGRLTLNPLRHIDPLGTLVIPAIGAISGVPLVGWARPTPVDQNEFRTRLSPRVAYAIVSAAGPVSNLLLAIIAVALRASLGSPSAHQPPSVALLLHALFVMNVSLFVFNLLPIAPLDGARLLPRSLDGFQRKIAPFGLLILMVILSVPTLREYVFDVPVSLIETALKNAFGVAP